MNKMTIIQLLNKIANGEEVPKYIRYRDISKHKYNTMMVCKENIIYQLDQCVINLNDEVEILKEKKIPKKLPYYSMEKIQKAKNKDEWLDERITLLERRVNDLHIKMNDLLDYLKSKGDE